MAAKKSIKEYADLIGKQAYVFIGTSDARAFVGVGIVDIEVDEYGKLKAICNLPNGLGELRISPTMFYTKDEADKAVRYGAKALKSGSALKPSRLHEEDESEDDEDEDED